LEKKFLANITGKICMRILSFSVFTTFSRLFV
jgi:hypothetical protein